MTYIIRPTRLETIRYARHGIVSLPLAEIPIVDMEDAFIDLEEFNRVSLPAVYWQKGKLSEDGSDNPRLVLGTLNRNSANIPSVKFETFDLEKKLLGVHIKLLGSSGNYNFDWDASPEYKS